MCFWEGCTCNPTTPAQSKPTFCTFCCSPFQDLQKSKRFKCAADPGRGHLGHILDKGGTGSIWEASGGIWEASGSIWEASGSSGSIWRHLGSIWESLEASGRHLEPSGEHLEASWKHLGGIWKHLGDIWEASGGHLEGLWGPGLPRGSQG